MSSSTTIRPLRDDERAWANALYASIQFAETPPDAIARVAERDGQRIGLGRLVTQAPDVIELGGIWTDEAARGHGVARQMVEALLACHAGGPLWCIPFGYLAAFYQSCGFAPATPPWPPAIAAKVADCIAHRLPEVAVLVR
ncbi:MAG: GNAT family N-acetyltransferase [Myxococcales bacterium]|nr:GNAT family N-acetyltransferase [Myxococcales bacterium]